MEMDIPSDDGFFLTKYCIRRYIMKKNLKSLMAFSLSAVLLLTGCGQKEQTETGSEAEMTGIERLVNKEEIRFASRVVDGNFDPCMGWGY